MYFKMVNIVVLIINTWTMQLFYHNVLKYRQEYAQILI